MVFICALGLFVHDLRKHMLLWMDALVTWTLSRRAGMDALVIACDDNVRCSMKPRPLAKLTIVSLCFDTG